MSSPSGPTRIFILYVNTYLAYGDAPAFRVAVKTELSYRNDTIKVFFFALLLEISGENNPMFNKNIMGKSIF